MSTLRERLAQKKRRRTVQPVQLDPPTAEETELVAALSLAAVKGKPIDTTRLEELRAERHVEVSFSALDSEVWEKVAATHPSPSGEDAGLDWLKALPVVAALCCDDESMQDDEAWAETLEDWSHGEKVHLWGALLAINAEAPAAHVPKD